MTPGLPPRVMQTLVESARLLERLHDMRIDTENTVEVSRIALAETYRLLHQSFPDPLLRSELSEVRYLDVPETSASTIVFR